jgi:hypothetical protein
MYTLKRPQVSRATAAKRMEHRMIDRNSIKKQLRRAGLYVMEEQVWCTLNVPLIDGSSQFWSDRDSFLRHNTGTRAGVHLGLRPR